MCSLLTCICDRACFSIHEYRRSEGRLAVSIVCSAYGSANMGKQESKRVLLTRTKSVVVNCFCNTFQISLCLVLGKGICLR